MGRVCSCYVFFTTNSAMKNQKMLVLSFLTTIASACINGNRQNGYFPVLLSSRVHAIGNHLVEFIYLKLSFPALVIVNPAMINA